jgi:hypothetical protein
MIIIMAMMDHDASPMSCATPTSPTARSRDACRVSIVQLWTTHIGLSYPVRYKTQELVLFEDKSRPHFLIEKSGDAGFLHRRPHGPTTACTAKNGYLRIPYHRYGRALSGNDPDTCIHGCTRTTTSTAHGGDVGPVPTCGLRAATAACILFEAGRCDTATIIRMFLNIEFGRDGHSCIQKMEFGSS